MAHCYSKCDKLVLLVCLLLLTVSSAFAQTIRGKVNDGNTGSGIPGATIVVVGTQSGTTSDADGNYTLKLAPASYRLAISFVGYQSVTVPVTVPATGEVIVNTRLQESQSSLSELVVIGSRAATARTNIQSVVPVDVITTKEMKSYAQVDVSQILNFVAPSFNSNRQTVTDGTDHIDPASLRGLGPDQTLVLVNGKRRYNTALININGSVGRGAVGTDMNVIPVAAVERIEVLRDGAAAQYGSDAIAGVINVVLKKNYEGLSASLMGGGSFTNMRYQAPLLGGGSVDRSQQLRDGQVLQFDISKGFRLGQRGSMTVSAQIVDRGRTSRAGEDNAPTIYLGASGGFPGTGLVPVAGRPALLAADAQLVDQRGYDRRNMIIGNSSSRNYGLFVNGGLPVGAKGEVYFTAGVTNRSGTGYGNNRIPVSRAQQPLAADGSLFYADGFLPAIKATLDDRSLTVGYKTKLGDWNVDLSNAYGQNAIRFDVQNSGNATLPSAANQQTEFYAGTLGFNQNTVNLDASRLLSNINGINSLNLAFGAEYRRDQYSIVAGESASYSGATANKVVPLAPLVIGGPSSGTGLALPGAQVFPGFQPTDELDRSRSNISLYADGEVQVNKRWLVDVATRYENFSDFGSQLTGKLASRYEFAEAFSLRGAISTGFRAPSLQQRYFNNVSTQFVAGLPSNTLTVNNDSDLARKVIGVDALRPETSVNYSLGFASKIGRGFTMTVDAYQIDIKDRILYSGAFTRASLGFNAADFVGINLVRVFANAANTQTRGIDIVATERLRLGKGQLTLSGAVNFNRTRVVQLNPSEFINRPANNETRGGNPDAWARTLLFDRSQIALLETGLPRSKVNLSAAYSHNKFDVSFRAVRFGEVRNLTNADPYAINAATGAFFNTQFARDNAGNALLDQTFNPIWISDVTIGYRITKMLTVQVGANNVFDVYPDQIYIDPRNATGSLDYNTGRDQSNRGRFLFPSNQGGFNGRFVFARLSATL